ncbi:MAG: hypothetical protein WDM78_06575 [Puia sp.]
MAGDCLPLPLRWRRKNLLIPPQRTELFWAYGELNLQPSDVLNQLMK